MQPEAPAADVEHGASSAPAPFWPGLNRRGAEWLGNFGALAAVLLFLAVVAASFWYLRQEEARREQEAVERDVEYAGQRLRLHMQERQELVMRLAREMADGEVRQTRWFHAHAESLMAQYPGLLALSWIDAQQRVLATQASPSVAAPRPWTDGQNLLRHAATGAGYAQARDSGQPVYAQPVTGGQEEPILQLHVPLVSHGQFAGDLLAEYSIDGLLRYDVPSDVLARYAGALLDGQGGRLLAGQSIPDRPALNADLPWAAKAIAYELPVAPVGAGLVLRAQAWRTSQSVLGGALFWLAAALSLLTVWVLLVNWRQMRRRQQAQAALQAETSFRRAIENSMMTGMRALDLQGRITYVNPAFCQMTGWSEGELVGCVEPFPYWPDEDRQALAARLREELAGAIAAPGFQMRVRRKNGSIFDARMYISPLIDGTGKHRGWIASITDITEPSRVRQQLAASNARFTNVLEALDASVSVAPMGSAELLYANRMYRLWFDGATSAGHLLLLEQAGTPENAAASPPGEAGDDELAGLPLASLAASQPERAEVYVEPLGKWLEVRSRYLHWVDGRLAQMVIATDITARRQAEELAAAQAERAQASSRLIAVGEMASSVAHELNQPLTAISNYCTGMIARVKDGGLGQSELLGALEKTARQAQRAGQVVQHIRGLVQRSAPRRSATQVAAIVEQTAELAEAELRRRQVRLERHVAADLPPVMADPILIEQVLLNLIKNGAESIDAAQREPARRRVELRVQAAEADGQPVVQFSVTDAGAGIAPEAFGRLYEVFFSTKREGLGIGLNLCRSIIESHQGRIQAENIYNEDRIAGCRFTFWLPA
ncbi:MAG: PAS domain S-box protein [Burkholderiaceae bacterium]|jgi:PAS domain S-box-containing protein|nr:PAS domain S-box protein [Burkholderiaceae bacterium]